MQRRSVVVRMWREETGMHGMISDPLTGWRRGFSSSEELWAALEAALHRAEPGSGSAQAEDNQEETG